MLSLRCKSCSAPLTAQPSDEIIRCEFCGSSQKLVDARAFLDQILLQVNAWVRQAVPVGMDMVTSGMVDPIARHTLFENNIRPRLTTEYGEYRFNCFNLLSHSMAVLPFMTDKGTALVNDPKDIFLFQAKAQQVMPLAVDEECRSLVSEISSLSVVYGYLLNNAGLMTELKPERYHFMTQNFDAAADSLKNVSKYAVLRTRLLGLSKLSKGMDEMMSLNVEEATGTFEEARGRLEEAKTASMQSPDMALMSQAIDQEMSVLRSSVNLAGTLNYAPGRDYASVIQPIRNLMEMFSTLQGAAPDHWRARFGDPSHHEKILASVFEIQRAKTGGGTLKVLPVQGTVLFPFWAVDIPYTFQTGALWRAQGVEVTEALLLAATFPLDMDAFVKDDPRAVLTDVFHARERSGFFNDAFKRMSGKERSISGGGPVRELINHVQALPPGGLRVVPPLSTPDDAVVIIQEYVSAVRAADKTIQNQLRLSAPRVTGLIFVPGVPDAMRPNVMPWLGGLAPKSVGNLQVLSGLAF